MNEIVNKFLLAGGKFMPEMHLKQQHLLIVLVDQLLETKNEFKNLKKQEIQAIFTKNELDKTCFPHDMAYGNFKDLKSGTFSDKMLRDKSFNIAKNPKYDGYQRWLVYKCFDKKATGNGVNIEVKHNAQLAKELHKPIIRNFKKRAVCSGFRDNIWGVDLADMQLISKPNKRFRFLLCVFDIFSKYAWVVSLKDKKGVSIVHAFQKILVDPTGVHSNRKPNKIWVHKGREFYNSSFKKWLNDI